jgi:hypothetical protein
MKHIHFLEKRLPDEYMEGGIGPSINIVGCEVLGKPSEATPGPELEALRQEVTRLKRGYRDPQSISPEALCQYLAGTDLWQESSGHYDHRNYTAWGRADCPYTVYIVRPLGFADQGRRMSEALFDVATAEGRPVHELLQDIE